MSLMTYGRNGNLKAKDTELTLEQVNEIPEWNSIDLDPVVKLQAEVSFKAGYEEACKDTAIGMEHFINIGRKEVVEWLHQDISREIHKDFEVVVFKAISDDWQAKLKEWGIEKGTD